MIKEIFCFSPLVSIPKGADSAQNLNGSGWNFNLDGDYQILVIQREKDNRDFPGGSYSQFGFVYNVDKATYNSVKEEREYQLLPGIDYTCQYLTGEKTLTLMPNQLPEEKIQVGGSWAWIENATIFLYAFMYGGGMQKTEVIQKDDRHAEMKRAKYKAIFNKGVEPKYMESSNQELNTWYVAITGAHWVPAIWNAEIGIHIKTLNFCMYLIGPDWYVYACW